MPEKLFRKIANRIQGRPDFKEESLNLEDAYDLIRSNPDSIEVKVVYHHPHKFLNERKTPEKAAKWAWEVFSLKKRQGQYVEGTHQVYSGGGAEKHYITLSHGAIEKPYGIPKKTRLGVAKIEFLVMDDGTRGDGLLLEIGKA